MEDLLDPLSFLMDRETMIEKWVISCNILEHEQKDFIKKYRDRKSLTQPYLPFLVPIVNLSLEGYQRINRDIKTM